MERFRECTFHCGGLKGFLGEVACQLLFRLGRILTENVGERTFKVECTE